MEAVDTELMKALAAEWNANQVTLEALWQKAGKPKRAVWKPIAEPVWDRQEKIEVALAPLLHAWATENRCAGNTLFGFRVVRFPKIREASGLTMHGNSIRRLIEYTEAMENQARMDEAARTMPDDEWDEMMSDFCTLTQEGQNTKDYLLESRERQHAAVKS